MTAKLPKTPISVFARFVVNDSTVNRNLRVHQGMSAVGLRTASINECISPSPADIAPGVYGQYLMLHPPHLQRNVLPVNVVVVHGMEHVAPEIVSGDFDEAEPKYPSNHAALIVRRIIKD